MDTKKIMLQGEFKEVDDKEMTITAYISTSARDRMDESLMPDGADLKRYNKNPIVLWAHDYNQPPIAKAMWTKRDGKGLISKMKFAPTDFAKEVYELFKGGFMNAFSVGFLPKEWEDGDGVKKARRTYTKWELLEYSAVPVPANPEALALAMSKGILKDATLIKSFQPDDTAPELPELIEVKETEKKEDSKVSELLTDISLLQKEVETLKKENNRLYTELYISLSSKEKKPEITDDQIRTIIADTVIGVIRHKQGKLTKE